MMNSNNLVNNLVNNLENDNTMNIIEFLNCHGIKWFPILLDIKINKKVDDAGNIKIVKQKVLCGIKHELYKRMKKDKNEITYVPYYGEFKSLTKEQLKARQNLIYTNEIEKIKKPSQIVKIAIDTSEYFQIDIDTPNIDKGMLYNWKSTTAYYKSLTKSYGYHIFMKVDEFHNFIKTYTDTKNRFQFKQFYINGDGDKINIFDDNKDGVELLTGQLSYANIDQVVYNKKQIVSINERDLPFFTDLLTINKRKNMKDIEKKKIEVLDYKNRFDNEEIFDHMNNISQGLIDNRDTHFKIICSLINGGYENIAMDCMFRSSNTKNKDLNYEFESFKNSNNGTISIKSLFYYSKESDSNAYYSLLKKYRGCSLPQKYKKELFNLNFITEKINQRYLPYSILENINLKQKTITHIKSHLGSGKTHIIKQFIKNNPSIQKIVYFAPRVLFARDVYNDLKDYGFKLYNTLKKDEYQETDKIIVQLESLYKIKKQNYDLIIIDEIESVLKQLTSKITNKNIVETYRTFDYILNNCNTIITADAFLSNNSIDIINSIKQNTISRTIVNDFNPYKRKAFEVSGFMNLVEKAIDQVNTKNERIVFISLIKGNADFASSLFNDRCPNKKIKYYHGSMSEKDKRFDNIEKEWSDVDILIYTPIITCGVNYSPEIPTFNSLYMWISPNSCCIRDLFQASLRVRTLINDECYYAFNYSFNRYSKTPNIISKIFENSEGNLLNIRKNLIEKQEYLIELGVAIPKLCDWGIKNLSYFIFEDYISNNNCNTTTHEYLRLCGYEIYPLDILPTFDESFNNNKSSLPYSYEEINTIDFMEYRFYERDIYNLTEEQKYQMTKYKFDELLNTQINTNAIDLNSVFKVYFNKMDILQNIINELSYKNKNHEEVINDINCKNQENLDLFIDTNFIKNKVNNDIKKIFNCDNLVHLTYSSIDIKNNLDTLTNVIKTSKQIYNFRTKRGNDEWDVKYINSCLKHILTNQYGFDVNYNRKKINKKTEYMYSIDHKHTKINHIEKIVENNKH